MSGSPATRSVTACRHYARTFDKKSLVRSCWGSASTSLGGPRLHDHAAVDQRHAIGNFASKPDLMRHHDHRHAVTGELFHDVEHFAHELRVERRRRLVEQHHLGVQRQRASDRYALLLPT